jgi:hypothetical protein
MLITGENYRVRATWQLTARGSKQRRKISRLFPGAPPNSFRPRPSLGGRLPAVREELVGNRRCWFNLFDLINDFERDLATPADHDEPWRPAPHQRTTARRR